MGTHLPTEDSKEDSVLDAACILLCQRPSRGWIQGVDKAIPRVSGDAFHSARPHNESDFGGRAPQTQLGPVEVPLQDPTGPARGQNEARDAVLAEDAALSTKAYPEGGEAWDHDDIWQAEN